MYKRGELEYQTLSPYISDQTLNLHYNKHYLNYLNKLNIYLSKINYDFILTKEQLARNIDTLNLNDRGEILYNLGGVLNHELYFKNLSLNKNNIPVKTIKKDIDEQFGSYDQFKNQFIKTSKQLVGSGYTFLVMNKDKKLEIVNFPNQDTPYMYDLTPIIALDLWEHAYYLDYNNNRDEYINSFFSIIDFEKINEQYEKIKKN